MSVILTIILIIVFAIIGYFIGKYITEQKKWAVRRAELERRYAGQISDLEKQILEAEKDKEIAIGDLKEENAEKLAELERKYVDLIKSFRKDAVARSRNTLLGKLWEQIMPYLPKFKHNPADMRFLGSPIDYIIFEGMNKRDIQRVIFLEVKTRGSKLSPQEKKLRDAIQKKRVKWEEIRFEDIAETTVPEDREMDEKIEKELGSIKKELSHENEEAAEDDGEYEFTCSNCGEVFETSPEEEKIMEERGKVEVECPYCDSIQICKI